MSQSQKNQQKKTRLVVSTPCKRESGKTWWVEVGNAHMNKDGSMNIYLDALPTNGQLQVRKVEVKERPNNNREDDSGWEGLG